MSSLIAGWGEGGGRGREGGGGEIPDIVTISCQNKMEERYTFIKYM